MHESENVPEPEGPKFTSDDQRFLENLSSRLQPTNGGPKFTQEIVNCWDNMETWEQNHLKIIALGFSSMVYFDILFAKPNILAVGGMVVGISSTLSWMGRSAVKDIYQAIKQASDNKKSGLDY